MRSALRHFAAAAVAVAVLAGCGGSSGGAPDTGDTPAVDHSTMDMSTTAAAPAATAPASSAPAAGAPATITITNYTFSPASLTVAPGTKITVTNNDNVPHDVDSADRTSFNTTPVTKGGTFTFTAPMTPGSYGYFCSVHPNMKGMLIVA